jgi:hypothetical protein
MCHRRVQMLVRLGEYSPSLSGKVSQPINSLDSAVFSVQTFT